MNFNFKEIKKLIAILDEADIAEFEYAQGDTRVHLVRTKQGHGPFVGADNSLASTLASQGRSQTGLSSDAEKTAKEEVPAGHLVASPFVGTFYRSPSPGNPSFVEIGSIVKKGQTLCIIEAMKLMNEIEADVDGKVVAIYQENGDLVEFGQKLFLIQ